MLRYILLAIIVASLLLVGVIFAQPDRFLVVRSTTIQAPADTVYSRIHDFQNWAAWSPWAKLDPKMREFFSGPQYGPGSAYDWSGNEKVGRGRMTILETRAPELLRLRIEFFEPFASTAEQTFTLQSQGNSTLISWSMSGDNDFFSKAMCLFMGGMDRVVGPDFEKGLAQLKSVSEAR